MADIISFESGVKEFSLNNKTDVRFAPTDSFFIERVYNVFNQLDKKQGEYRDSVQKASDGKIFDVVRKIDNEIREEINSIFGKDICTPVFGDMSLLTVSDGLPVWANLLLAIIDQFDGAFAAEQKKTNPRIAKYTAKYTR